MDRPPCLLRLFLFNPDRMSDNISIEVVDSIAPIRDDWKRLDDAARKAIDETAIRPIDYSFYQTLPWNEFVEDYYTRIAPAKRQFKHLEYLVAKRDGVTVAILPLLVCRLPKKVEFPSWKTSGINCVVSPGVSDPEMRPVFNRLLTFTAERFKGYKVKLYDVPLDTQFYDALVSLPGLVATERESFHVPLSQFEDFDAYYASLNKKLRHNIKTRSNHFTHGDLSWELREFDSQNPPSKEYWKKIWKIFYLRKLVWRNRSQSALRKLYCRWETRKEIRKGLKTASFTALKASKLYSFEINGVPAAFAFIYEHDGFIVVPKLAIDTAQRAHAPGILMIKEIMRRCYDRGVRDFDFCRGSEPYKQQVGGVNTPIARIKGKF